jgi:hypothetical protein
MLVRLETHGGIAGGIRRPAQTLDTDRLSTEAAAELARLVAAARSTGAVTQQIPGRVRDGASYAITVEDDSSRIVLTAGDGAMPPAFAELRRFVQQLSKKGL